MGPVKAFDPQTNTISYVVRDPNGHAAAVIDSVLDFDHASGTTQTSSADKIILMPKKRLWIFNGCLKAMFMPITFPQLPIYKKNWAAKLGSETTSPLFKILLEKYLTGHEFQRDGSQFDQLFDHGDVFHIGQMRVDVLHTPGHTLPHLCHRRRSFRWRYVVHARFWYCALRFSGRLLANPMNLSKDTCAA